MTIIILAGYMEQILSVTFLILAGITGTNTVSELIFLEGYTGTGTFSDIHNPSRIYRNMYYQRHS